MARAASRSASPRSTTTRAPRDLPTATLGKRRDQPFTYSPALLESVPLAARGDDGGRLWVSLACLRFSSLCPVTGQPDWGEFTINYLPTDKLVESKSLKEYLTSFRMHGDFHEDLCRIIGNDLVALLAPRFIEVTGLFDSRGSIAIWPYWSWAAAGDQEAAELRAHRLRDYAPGRWAARDAR